MDKNNFSNGAIPPFLQFEPTLPLPSLHSSDYFLNTNLENSTDQYTSCRNNNNNNNIDSTMTSCYTTNPRFTHFGNRSFKGRTGQDRLNNGKHLGLSGNLSRVLSSPSFNENTQPQMETTLDLDHNPNSNEDCSVSTLNCRKRKANSSGKGKEIGKMDVEKSSEAVKEAKKDYIHVRARRGEATDSHSLAERVRREKISQRMKLLQDLVPGCNKVTGKALMLDEIINYVQSLQRQVEFLSMKLATVNPRPDFHIDNLLPKDICQQNGCLAQNMFPLDGFSENIISQIPTICEDELQSIVQMGFNHNFNQDMTLCSQTFSVPADSTSHMKIEM